MTIQGFSIESILFNDAVDSVGRFDADVVMFAVVVFVRRQFFLDKFGIVKEYKARVHHLFDRPNLKKRGLAGPFSSSVKRSSRSFNSYASRPRSEPSNTAERVITQSEALRVVS